MKEVCFKLIKKLLYKATKLNRIKKQMIMVFVDICLILSVLLLSFSLRLDYLFWPSGFLSLLFLAAPVIGIPVFVFFRLYRSVIRYIGIQAISSVLQAVTIYALIWGLFGYMVSVEIPMKVGLPRSVIFINWILSIIVIGGSRVFAKWLFSESKLNNIMKNNVIIFGAGPEGRQLSHALQLSNKYNHIAYIDDTSENGRYINAIPVLSENQIESIINKENVSEVLLAMPSISLKKRNEIIKRLSLFSVQVRSLPSFSKLAEGKVKIEDLLEISVSDLLERESVTPNEELLIINIKDKAVLVTGAGGSIGSELCRQILLLRPKKLILYEISESSLYQIEQELSTLNTINIEVAAVIGSVRDFNRMKNIINFFGVETLYHAAAYKHVPLVEYNPSQGVLNNSIGTLIAAKAAIAEKVQTFVLISTDKAVRPTSTMGASKRIAELILQALAKQSHNTLLTMVRFGNVLDSSGSVIPLFKKQIKQGGPITVTDINMVRYFMTIPEAVELVIQAGAMCKGGDVFVLDMGEPVKIYDLAVKMIHLSGLQILDDDNVDGDIEIVFSGLRPGEKLYEELLVGDNISKTENKLIMRAKEEMIDWEILESIINELNIASEKSDIVKIKELIKQIVPDFNQSSHKIS
jgi:FlaA1/EpsC-like NDP-sugar epimerase